VRRVPRRLDRVGSKWALAVIALAHDRPLHHFRPAESAVAATKGAAGGEVRIAGFQSALMNARPDGWSGQFADLSCHVAGGL
jgi:hypothetical protein